MDFGKINQAFEMAKQANVKLAKIEAELVEIKKMLQLLLNK